MKMTNHSSSFSLLILSILSLCYPHTTQTDAFAPSPKNSVVINNNNNHGPIINNHSQHLSFMKQSGIGIGIGTRSKSQPSTSQLNYGVIVPVPDDFFTVAGISLGFGYTITRSWNRVVVENVAWEKRLEDERMKKLDDEDNAMATTSTYTELDLRKMDAEASQSSYGPEAMERRRQRRRRRVLTLDDDELHDEEEDAEYENSVGRSEERNYSMTDTQINDFEEKYGVRYDPYYDEPYTVDELPDDSSFIEDKVYGDRRYQNGEIFYRDENDKNLFWRQGGRPRLKQFWELF